MGREVIRLSLLVDLIISLVFYACCLEEAGRFTGIILTISMSEEEMIGKKEEKREKRRWMR
jgi:hypothetical protein